jgi:fructose-bisphosphate aldolase class 1
MNSQLLKETAKLLFVDNKGLLAMDESNGTCNKREGLIAN